MLDQFHVALRVFHVSLGAVGLVLFWIPVLTKKGSPLHRRAGRLFVWTIYAVAGGGFASSTWAIASPASFLGLPDPPAELVANVRFLFSILATLACLALTSAVLGARVLRVKNHPRRLLNRPLAAVLAAQLLSSLFLVGFAGWMLWSSNLQSRYYVSLTIGVLGLIDFAQQLRYVTMPQPSGAWFYKHLDCMIGCGIAFYTAATVTVAVRVLQWNPPGPLALAPWLLPTLIGVPAVALTKRHYQRKFGDASPAAASNDIPLTESSI